MKGVFYMLEELPVSDHGRELTLPVVENALTLTSERAKFKDSGTRRSGGTADALRSGRSGQ